MLSEINCKFTYLLRLSILAISVFGAVAILEAHTVVTRFEINCFIRHLKDEKVLDERYPSYHSLTVTDATKSDCDKVLKETKRTNYEASTDSLKETLLKKYFQRLSVEQEQCIKSKLEETQFINNSLLAVVYYFSPDLTPEYMKAKTEEIYHKNIELATNATQSCVFNTPFAESFQIFEF